MAARSHWKNGFFLQKGGYEYTLTLVSASLAIGLIGPGSYSLDALFGSVLPEVPVFGVLALAALLVDIIGMLIASRNGTMAHPGSLSKAS